MPTSIAGMKAVKKYEDKAYDKVLVRLPKGTAKRIEATGESKNGFVNRLVKAELERMGR